MLYRDWQEASMLSVFFHRKRKLANDIEAAAKSLQDTPRVYGLRLLVRGALWASMYLVARGLLRLDIESTPLRVAIALLPMPWFVWYLWTWFQGAAAMDELQRRIELEALGFAFPAAVVYLMTIGLLDIAVALPPEDFSLHHVWFMLPLLYYVGLWRAKRRYE
jgi:hypothetical protein